MLPTYPILEFDPSREAMIDPAMLLRPGVLPERAVLCFFQDAIARAIERHPSRIALTLRGEMGENPVHALTVNGGAVALAHPGVGAPLAGAVLEEIIASGVRKAIVCGGAGVLVPQTVVGHLVVPTSAVRDEGTSYHYCPPGHDVAPHPAAVDAIEGAIRRRGLPWVRGKTWTTDAFYRETRGKVSRRREEGCLTVEMEAAALFAVAEFRGVTIAQVLYCGDDLSGDAWDHRRWHGRDEIRAGLLELAIEACMAL